VNEVTSRRIVLQPSTTEVIFAWFQRVIAGYCLLFGILYWIRLIGFYPGPLWRFDLMPVHWQVTGDLVYLRGDRDRHVCRLSRSVRPPAADHRLARRGGAALYRLQGGDLAAEAPDPAVAAVRGSPNPGLSAFARNRWLNL